MAWNAITRANLDDCCQATIGDGSEDSGFVDYRGDDDVVRDQKLYEKDLSRSYRDTMKLKNNVDWSKEYRALPNEPLEKLKTQITIATTGPKEGIRDVKIQTSTLDRLRHPNYNGRIKQFTDWTRSDSRAFGIATSLYEHNPLSDFTTGDPVADVFAVIARENSCILSLADGVNWGPQSRLAARCAVAGSIQYLNHYLCSVTNTHEVMDLLFRSFELAQECIIEKGATMTTLCTAVICEIRGSDKWAVCVINVGDSLGFVYSKDKNHIQTREITIGSHCSETERDMRCPGGSLGPVDGHNPDLRNLTFSYTQVSKGDIVFLVSDGVSDNFDPDVSHCKNCQGHLRPSVSMDSLCTITTKDSTQTLRTDADTHLYTDLDIPTIRHDQTLRDMQNAIELETPDESLSAQTLCANLINHVAKCTQEKRISVERILREGQQQGLKQKINDNEIRKIMRELPGKLDHAAVAAFEVGEFRQEPFRVVSEGTNNPTRQIIDRITDAIHGLRGTQPDDGRQQLVSLLSPK